MLSTNKVVLLDLSPHYHSPDRKDSSSPSISFLYLLSSEMSFALRINLCDRKCYHHLCSSIRWHICFSLFSHFINSFISCKFFFSEFLDGCWRSWGAAISSSARSCNALLFVLVDSARRYVAFCAESYGTIVYFCAWK